MVMHVCVLWQCCISLIWSVNMKWLAPRQELSHHANEQLYGMCVGVCMVPLPVCAQRKQKCVPQPYNYIVRFKNQLNT